MFDWNDLRFFLELQRSDRLLSAAKRLNTTHSTVARHIESIEQSLGTALFVQHAQGYELTPSGQALLKHAEAMENVALLAQEEITQAITPLGKIRLGVTEGIGIMFFTPRMNALFERYPGLEVELVAVPRFVSILNREAEISIHGATQRRPADHSQTHRLPPGAVRQPGVRIGRRRCATVRTWPGIAGSAMSTICCSAKSCCFSTVSAGRPTWCSEAPA